MCWLHPGLAFKLPCVLLSLFMISVTLASLPCHFTNCCRGVYGEAPFPNVSDFREPAQKPSAFTAWSQKCVCLPGQGLLFPSGVHVGACRSSLCVCVCARVPGQGKAGQLHNSRENGGGDSESPTYSLAHTVGNLYFVVLPGTFEAKAGKKAQVPSS